MVMDGGGGGQEPLQSPGCSELHSVLLPAVLWLLIAAMHLEALGAPRVFQQCQCDRVLGHPNPGMLSVLWPFALGASLLLCGQMLAKVTCGQGLHWEGWSRAQ